MGSLPRVRVQMRRAAAAVVVCLLLGLLPAAGYARPAAAGAPNCRPTTISDLTPDEDDSTTTTTVPTTVPADEPTIQPVDGRDGGEASAPGGVLFGVGVAVTAPLLARVTALAASHSQTPPRGPGPRDHYHHRAGAPDHDPRPADDNCPAGYHDDNAAADRHHRPGDDDPTMPLVTVPTTTVPETTTTVPETTTVPPTTTTVPPTTTTSPRTVVNRGYLLRLSDDLSHSGRVGQRVSVRRTARWRRKAPCRERPHGTEDEPGGCGRSGLVEKIEYGGYLSGTSIRIRHDDGWSSHYIHLNNDLYGTDDGRGEGVRPGLAVGDRVKRGELIGWVGDSGNAEGTIPHLHFELRNPAVGTGRSRSQA